jgi:hypothetical protein
MAPSIAARRSVRTHAPTGSRLCVVLNATRTDGRLRHASSRLIAVLDLPDRKSKYLSGVSTDPLPWHEARDGLPRPEAPSLRVRLVPDSRQRRQALLARCCEYMQWSHVSRQRDIGMSLLACASVACRATERAAVESLQITAQTRRARPSTTVSSS